MPKPKPLSQQHRRFIAAYRRCRVAVRAYQEVYPRASHASADTHGPALLRDSRISSEIARLDAEALKAEHMSADEALARLARIIKADIGEIADADGNVRSIREIPREFREIAESIEWDLAGRPKVKLPSRNAALTNLLKHHKLITERHEITDKTLEKILDEIAERDAGK